MPNVPAQFPNIDLPGAEYFSLAPNATMALQGRRRFSQTQTVTAPGAASTVFTNAIILEQPFPAGAGIFIHHVWMALSSNDLTGKLQVQSSYLALNNSSTPNPPGSPGNPIGNALLTQLTPTGSVVAITERDRLIAQRDLLPNFSFPVAPPPGQLNLVWALALLNTDIAANSHQMVVFIGGIYTRLDGLTE